MGILRLSMESDPDWGLHEAALWVASALNGETLDRAALDNPEKLHDILKGCFEREEFAAMSSGGAYATLRIPQRDFGFWYAAVAVEQGGDHRMALGLIRRAGERRPPTERDAGATILDSFQSILAWPPELVDEFRTTYIEGTRGRPVSDFELAVAEDPNSAQKRFSLGIALQQAGRYDEAVDSYRHAAELDPYSAALHRALAGALHAAGRYRSALTSIEAALALDNVDPVSHTTHGIILNKLSNRRKPSQPSSRRPGFRPATPSPR